VIAKDKYRKIAVKTAPTTKGDVDINRGYRVKRGHCIEGKGKREEGKRG
jgi:hypothetical protein